MVNYSSYAKRGAKSTTDSKTEIPLTNSSSNLHLHLHYLLKYQILVRMKLQNRALLMPTNLAI